MAVIREAVFSILGEKVEGAGVVDMFAGTGVFGLEALSRGADFAVFVEKSPRMVGIIKENLEKLNLKEKAKIWQEDALKAVGRLPRCQGLDIVFLDPPFFSEHGPRVLKGLLQSLYPYGSLIVRVHKKESWPEEVFQAFGKGWCRSKDRVYGESKLLFFERGQQNHGTSAP